MFGKKMVEGKARILAFEGLTSGSSNTDLHGNVWMHYRYIVEVHPDGGSAFRAEVKVKVVHGPSVGDLVNARYDADSHKVELVLEGDPRYDPKLRRAADKAKRHEMLHGNPGSGFTPGMGMAPLDPELQELLDLEEAERLGTSSAPPAPSTFFAPSAPSAPAASGSASRMDRLQQVGDLRAQGLLTDAEFEQEKARILSEP